MWQTGNGTMIVKVRWFYHPEETKGDSVPLGDKRVRIYMILISILYYYFFFIIKIDDIS
jgi:hypothetical protein